MSVISRRHFLQFAGSTLATFGLSHLDIMCQGKRYARVLAQSTPRKLALLIGINTYPSSPLQGCVNDVELQRKLLIHRFGFNPVDIFTLTNEQATREMILTAFEEHLIKQANPGDVVVFHFSGHGSQIAEPDSESGLKSTLVPTLVPVDSTLSSQARANSGVVSDITSSTLFLLMYLLPTDNTTIVLDCGYSRAGEYGNLTGRSLEGGFQLKASPDEIEYQRQWLQRVELSPEKFRKLRQKGIAKGVVTAATGRNSWAADVPFNDFHAGAFTFAMTQYLWQQTGRQPVRSAIADIGRSTAQIAPAQSPEIEVEENSKNDQQPIYFQPLENPPSEAVITQVGENGADVWLGGVNSNSFGAFDQGTILTLLDAQGYEHGLMQLESRLGLIGQAKPFQDIKLGVLKPGFVLQERVRLISTNVTLKIGLDSSLGKDKALAEQALKEIKQIEPLPVLQRQEIQYILGRIPQDNRELQKKPGEELSEEGTIGLFTPALEPIPGTFGAAGEPVEAAVTRLQPKFKSLLATYLIKMILNAGSSRLNVVVSMNIDNSENEMLVSTRTVRGGSMQDSTQEIPRNSKQLLIRTPLQFKVTNNENRNLYVSILIINPAGEITVIFPRSWATNEAMLVKAGNTLQVPEQGKDQFKITVVKPLGMFEVLVIASSNPLEELIKALQVIAAHGEKVREMLITLVNDEPKVVIDSLLADLNRGTRSGLNIEFDNNVHGVDTKQLAAMSITFESIEKPSGYL